MKVLTKDELLKQKKYEKKDVKSSSVNSSVVNTDTDVSGAVVVDMMSAITRTAKNVSKQVSKSNEMKVIAVVSGKGGVGKSTVSALIALKLRDEGFKVGLLDADITAPNLPFMFRTVEQMKPSDLIEPVEVEGIKIASVGALTDRIDKPILLMGQNKMEMIKQFANTVDWGDIDFLVIDTPPGTSDEILTVFSLFNASYVIVTTPRPVDIQDALRMKNLLTLYNKRILGIVVNSAYVQCPNSNERVYLGDIEAVKYIELPVLFELPFDPKVNGDVRKIYELYGDSVNVEVIINA